MRRTYLMIALLILASMACTLTTASEDNNVVIATNPIPLFPTATSTLYFYPTVTPTLQSSPTATAFSPGGVMPGCTVRTDWYPYAVVSGDTLGEIAQRTGTTVDVLTNANCLTNPDQLQVGQIIRVPRQPISTATPPPVQGVVEVYPVLNAGAGSYWLQQGAQVNIRWTAVPANTHHVVFFWRPHNFPASTNVIGTDYNLGDGAGVPWTVPTNLSGVLYARAELASNIVLASSSGVTVYSTDAAPQQIGEVTFSPYQSFTGGWYELEAGQAVTVQWTGAPANIGPVSFFSAPTGTGSTETLIGVDNNPNDGVSIGWVVPSGLSAHFRAEATGTSGTRYVSNTTQAFAADPSPVNNYGQIDFAPYLSYDNGVYTLQSRTDVTVRWSNHPGNLTGARFYFAPTGTGTTATLIGTDNNPADGVSIQWRVPDGLSAHVYAEGTVSGGATYTSTYRTTLSSEPIPDEGQGELTVSPYISYEGGAYELEFASTVTLGWTGAPANATAVTWYLIPTGTGTFDLRTAIATDNNPADGTSATWTVPSVWAHLYVEASLPDGRTVGGPTVNVYAEAP